jgi:hypothetical protein
MVVFRWLKFKILKKYNRIPKEIGGSLYLPPIYCTGDRVIARGNVDDERRSQI